MADTVEKEKKEEKAVVDISAFFNRKNEEDGAWFEPNFNGTPLGIEFKVIGSNSNAAAKETADYKREMAQIEGIKDEVKKNDREMDAIARYAAALVRDVRAKGNVAAQLNGKPLTYTKEAVYEIMLNSSVIARAVLNFSFADGNFINKNQL
ncbi:MAG: hypothetical protein J6V90_07930 [Treponema sp.]|nr:hypothetical protein [Treponema sp.]